MHGVTGGRLAVWLREFRLPFLVTSTMSVAVGTACAVGTGAELSRVRLALALVGMWAVHLGCNVLNDYFDHLSGNDSANRWYGPFSGGSRVIQEGLIAPRAIHRMGVAMLGIGALAGGVLVAGWGLYWLVPIGAAGVCLAYGYGARPIAFGYRGWGEAAVFLAYGPLGACGAGYVQAGRFEAAWLPSAAAVGLTVAQVLLVNELPDYEADRSTGKRTLVVMLGRGRAVAAMAGVFALAPLVRLWPGDARPWPVLGAGFALAGVLAAGALAVAWRNRLSPRRLRPASAMTIGFHVTVSLTLIAAALGGRTAS